MGGNGAVVACRWYYPYGETRAATSTPPTDRLYTGQRWEPGLGLYDYRARYYHPVLGRFIRADPLVPAPGNPQSLNRYAYVTNNPLRYRDPSGHWPETAWDIANIGWDIYEVYRDPGNAWNWVALAVDVGAAVLPAVPAGVGLVVRGGKAAKAAVEVASHADEVVDAARALSRADEAADAVRAATNLADNAIEVTRGKPPIVIGENMERVKRYANQIGAQTINDFIPTERWTMEANEQWIKQMRMEGRESIDIGPDFGRRRRLVEDGKRPDSPAYNLERRVLKGYEGYHRVFERYGKYQGGVPGLDW